jgi:hypothetical protein
LWISASFNADDVIGGEVDAWVCWHSVAWTPVAVLSSVCCDCVCSALPLCFVAGQVGGPGGAVAFPLCLVPGAAAAGAEPAAVEAGFEWHLLSGGVVALAYELDHVFACGTLGAGLLGASVLDAYRFTHHYSLSVKHREPRAGSV